MRYALLVTYTSNGDQAYIREGYRVGHGPVARFNNRREAEEMKASFEVGIGSIGIITIVPWSSMLGTELEHDSDHRRNGKRPRP